jgi:hypothetical protein
MRDAESLSLCEAERKESQLAADKAFAEYERDHPLEDYSSNNRAAIPHERAPLAAFRNAAGTISILQPKEDWEDDGAIISDMSGRLIHGKRSNGRTEDKYIEVDPRCLPALIERLQQLARGRPACWIPTTCSRRS